MDSRFPRLGSCCNKQKKQDGILLDIPVVLQKLRYRFQPTPTMLPQLTYAAIDPTTPRELTVLSHVLTFEVGFVKKKSEIFGWKFSDQKNHSKKKSKTFFFDVFPKTIITPETYPKQSF